ncbi:MAG: hypothetical protein WDO71_09295 [Bacteroidota bacterium]
MKFPAAPIFLNICTANHNTLHEEDHSAGDRGFSGEAVISYRSAATIGNNLDSEKFNVYKIDINPEGWYYQFEDGRKISIDKNDFPFNWTVKR